MEQVPTIKQIETQVLILDDNNKDTDTELATE